LFQPKNDHLLFAYIGVSLQMRKRSLKTEIRARLATKRKAKKVLGNFRPTLIRDASEDRYPWLAETSEDVGKSWTSRAVNPMGSASVSRDVSLSSVETELGTMPK
jgi:hypothetical protein